MKLTWQGHSCFLLEGESGSLVFDPYAPGSVPGLTLPAMTADEVVCSHGHRDHNYRIGIILTGRENGFRITAFHSFHDEKQGTLRGGNQITLVEAEGLRLVHLGDQGCMPERAQIEALHGADVLMIPVGGYYTIDGAEAWTLTELLEPRIVIPMHYRGEGFGYGVIGTAETFLKKAGAYTRQAGNTLTVFSGDGQRGVQLLTPPRV